MLDSIKEYIDYVNEQIQVFKKNSDLVDLGLNEVTPQKINNNLAVFTQVNIGLNGEYQRKKAELVSLQREYDRWWDEHFVLMRNQMAEGKPASYKVAVKEIEIELRNSYADEFATWNNKITTADLNVSFIRRLLEQWKMHCNILIALSQNMRQEISSLSLDNKVNNPEVKVRRRLAE